MSVLIVAFVLGAAAAENVVIGYQAIVRPLGWAYG